MRCPAAELSCLPRLGGASAVARFEECKLSVLEAALLLDNCCRLRLIVEVEGSGRPAASKAQRFSALRQSAAVH